jgi:hypothetical protein
MTDANKSISSPRTSSASVPSGPMDAERLKQALSIGLKTLKDSGSKAAAARVIYDLIHMESRDVILQAFIDGATHGSNEFVLQPSVFLGNKTQSL